LTNVLDRLEARGYTARAIHPDDRRSFLISVTRDGKDGGEQGTQGGQATRFSLALRR
jgi:hypothetical protein